MVKIKLELEPESYPNSWQRSLPRFRKQPGV